MIKELYGNTYPGRGIIIGASPSGKYAVAAYFIMGRSVNSRNRVFEETEDGIKTEAADPSLLSDPSLIIYHPVRTLGDYTIVTNGDQTDTVFEFMQGGKTFEDALSTRCFEPDEPNFTPRISGILKVMGGKASYKLSILKKYGEGCQRNYFNYECAECGRGHLIHTYETDGNPIPSFSGEPKSVEIPEDIGAFAEEIWSSLDESNRVSLFVRYIDMARGEGFTKIINKEHKND